VKMQYWNQAHGFRMILRCSRGAMPPGKGDDQTDHRTNEPPRLQSCCLGTTPSDQQKTQCYFQRYVEEFPFSRFEMVLFESNCTNRAGVERVDWDSARRAGGNSFIEILS